MTKRANEMCYENLDGDWIHLFHHKKIKLNCFVSLSFAEITVKL